MEKRQYNMQVMNEKVNRFKFKSMLKKKEKKTCMVFKGQAVRNW